MAEQAAAMHPQEGHTHSLGDRINWLRAGVLGANDGIVSTAGVVAGVAGATSNLTAILTAGVAAAVAGSLSMAGGEYVSVSTQRDTERAALARETWELTHLPEEEESELAGLYRAQGLSADLSGQVARELTEHDALNAHARIELGIDPGALTSPWSAALASFVGLRERRDAAGGGDCAGDGGVEDRPLLRGHDRRPGDHGLAERAPRQRKPRPGHPPQCQRGDPDDDGHLGRGADLRRHYRVGAGRPHLHQPAPVKVSAIEPPRNGRWRVLSCAQKRDHPAYI